MKIKNLTPFPAGPKVTSRRPPRPDMTLVVRGTFALRTGKPLEALDEQGSLTAEAFDTDDDDRRGACLYPGDFADLKLRTDILVAGTCHVPGQRPVTDCPVRISVGGWSKILRIVGRRFWSDDLPGARMSAPAPFTTMPIDLSHAFGGPGYARNPVGMGFSGRELPNVEHAGVIIRQRRDDPGPAGFGPLSSTWPQRAGKMGKEYGRAWRKERAPFYAVDFDWTFFNAAPEDQQLEGYLRGDEKLVFQNLHPTEAVLESSLPGIRLRAFVKDVEGRFREVRMNLDTLFADLDAGIVVLAWRGLDPVKEDDLTDVASVLVASEPLGAEPLPAEEYRAQLEAFEEDPIGLKNAVPAGLLELAERLEKEKEGEVSPAEPGKGSAERIPRLLEGLLAHTAAADEAEVARMSASLGATVDFKTAVLDAAKGPAEAPPLIPLKPGGMPVIRIGQQLREMLARGEPMRRAAAAEGRVVPELEAMDALARDPRIQQIDPAFKPPGAGDPPPEQPGPGRNLAGQDLRGRDLRGRDLRGANLEGALLTSADLSGALLQGANLRYAVLYKANLGGAHLDDADLTLAQASRVRAEGASFVAATLEQASFEAADLTFANLEGAKGEYVRFEKADLSKARAKGCSLTLSSFLSATLGLADFTGALLVRCNFTEARAAGAVFAGASLAGSSFEDADARKACFVRVNGTRTMWAKAKLDDADFRTAWMPDGYFREVTAHRATFAEAYLKDCVFYRAALDDATFAQANLFAADLRKAALGHTSFRGANLYDSKFLGAAGKGCDFEGANLKRSTLEASS